MSNYTLAVAWSGKDALSDGDAAKVISGSDFNTEFTAVQTAVNTKADINGSASESFSAVTATAGTDTTQVATTAFVNTKVTGTENTFTKTQIWTKGSDVTSATALTIGDGNYFDVTGTTTVTSITTVGIGATIKLHFDGAVLLTHSATDLYLPGGANVTTAAGDEFEFTEYATGDWRCTGYALASGTSIISATSSADTSLSNLSATGEQMVCKAWANWNGTTSTLRDSYNISSLTDNGTGRWVLNFTTVMSNANYTVGGSTGHANDGNYSLTFTALTKTTSGASITTGYVSASANMLEDHDQSTAMIFGD